MRRHFRVRPDPFQARLLGLVAGTFFLMALLSIRLFTHSVVEHEANLAKAQQEYTVRKDVEPVRGTIYAVDGQAATADPGHPEAAWVPVATNEPTYSLSVVPKNILNKQATAAALAPWAQLSKDDLFAKIDNDKLYLPPLRDGLSEDDKNKIVALHLPGVFLTQQSQRIYPEGQFLSQVLGFVSSDGKGTYGLEQQYNAELSGAGGQEVAERDVLGRILSAQDTQPVKDGDSLVLTVDRNVQGFVEQTLQNAITTYKADSGTVVVMDVKTGGIIAMANAPTFDPNNYRNVPKDQVSVFNNPAVSSVWEPGSVFKTVVMASALDAGAVQPETASDFGASVAVQGYVIHTAEHKAFGHETMAQILQNSDNVGMVWVSDKLGSQPMYDYLQKFGFGQKTGIDLPAEATGYLLNGSKWADINRATISFGQGVSVTPLQVATALATFANGGNQMQPHIVDKIIGPDGKIVSQYQPKVRQAHVVSAQAADQIISMMVSVVTQGNSKRAQVPGYLVAGKTGTAQVPRPASEGGGYYPDKTVGVFGAILPADQPRFAIVVKLDNPKTVNFAESSAAPTFAQIAQFMVNYYQIPPTQTTTH